MSIKFSLLKALRTKRERARCVEFSPDMRYLAAISEPERRGEWAMVDLWILDNWRPVLLEDFWRWRWGGHAVAFSPDGKLLAVAAWAQYPPQGAIYLAKLGPKGIEVVDKVNPDGLRARCAKFSPEGRFLVSTSDAPHIKGAVIFQVGKDLKLKLVRALKGHEGFVNSLDISPDGKVIATGSDDRTVRLWSFPDGRPLKVLGPFKFVVNSVRFSPRGDLLAVGLYGNRALLFPLPSLERAAELHRRRMFGLFSLSFDPSGELLAWGTGVGKVLVWSVKGRSVGCEFKAHVDRVNWVSFSPDGKLLASAGNDGFVKVWRGG